jgi:pyridoxamine 5'-phosphate oxidase family protein
MSAFTSAEIEYLEAQRLGRLATVGMGNQPHVVPVGFRYNREEDAIEIGGHCGFSRLYKYRDVMHYPQVAFLVDDLVSTSPWTVRGIEIRGRAEIVETGGTSLGTDFDPEMFRIRPSRVISWGIDTHMYSAKARSVV